MMYCATLGSNEPSPAQGRNGETVNTPGETKGLSFEGFMGAMKMMSNE